MVLRVEVLAPLRECNVFIAKLVLHVHGCLGLLAGGFMGRRDQLEVLVESLFWPMITLVSEFATIRSAESRYSSIGDSGVFVLCPSAPHFMFKV